MKLTRVIAVGIMLGSVTLSALSAQTLRNSAPPAEFPPASYKGNQYVDSRGCIYIRAGIDGNVTWVPRVSRSRKQVCGYKPSAVANSQPTPAPKAARAPVIITATPAPATPSAASVKARPVPAAAVTPPTAPARTPRVTSAQRKPSPGPVPTVIGSAKKAPARPKTTSAPVAKAPAAAPSPAPVATVVSAPQGRKAATPTPTPTPTRAAPTTPAGGCSNASAFSQQFINKRGGRFKVRCGPQTEAPVTYARGEKHSAVTSVPSDTRVVPRHVHDKRQNTTNVSVPAGYKAVWDDGRLNPHRAERTLRPAQVRGVVNVPSGYKLVDWGDNRLNLNRGVRTAQGDAQSNQIWSNTVPRTLVNVPTRARVVTVARGTAPAQDPQTVVTRLSTRSAPVAPPAASSGRRIYVRVAIYSAEAEARAAAQSLARAGLPMHLGVIKSSGKKVVLAGPFATKAQARTALGQVRGAGFRRARLSK